MGTFKVFWLLWAALRNAGKNPAPLGAGGILCVLLLSHAWTSAPPRAAMLSCALPHVASVSQSGSCVWMSPVVGASHPSHDGNHTRVLLSRMCHGVSILGNSYTSESLKIAACLESRTCVCLWQGDGGCFPFQHGGAVLCSSMELLPCKVPTLFAETIPPWLCGEP